MKKYNYQMTQGWNNTILYERITFLKPKQRFINIIKNELPNLGF